MQQLLVIEQRATAARKYHYIYRVPAGVVCVGSCTMRDGALHTRRKQEAGAYFFLVAAFFLVAGFFLVAVFFCTTGNAFVW